VVAHDNVLAFSAVEPLSFETARVPRLIETHCIGQFDERRRINSIVARLTEQDVRAVIAFEAVRAFAAFQNVGIAAPVQFVVVDPAIEPIPAGAAVKPVESGLAVEEVRAVDIHDEVIAAAGIYGIVTRSRKYPVGLCRSAEGFRLIGAENVVERGRVSVLGARGAEMDAEVAFAEVLERDGSARGDADVDPEIGASIGGRDFGISELPVGAL